MNLDEIREAVESKYQTLDIEVGGRTVVLLNPIRLPKNKRDQLAAIQKEIGDEGADTLDCMKRMLKTVIEKPADAKVLLDQLGDDLAMYAEVVSQYGKRTQVGEA